MEQVKREDAERFQRVWRRVTPEGNPAILPVPPEQAEGREGLPVPVTEEGALLGREQSFQRSARQLWQRTGNRGFARLAQSSGERARQLGAAAFLVTGLWPAPPRPGGTDLPKGLPALYQALLALEDGYRALLERAEDAVLLELYDALAERCRGDRALVLRLAAGQRFGGPL